MLGTTGDFAVLRPDEIKMGDADADWGLARRGRDSNSEKGGEGCCKSRGLRSWAAGEGGALLVWSLLLRKWIPGDWVMELGDWAPDVYLPAVQTDDRREWAMGITPVDQDER